MQKGATKSGGLGFNAAEPNAGLVRWSEIALPSPAVGSLRRAGDGTLSVDAAGGAIRLPLPFHS